MRDRSKRLSVITALALSLSVLAVASASAAAAVTVTKVTPETGPEFAATSVTIRGTGFSTTPGATTVSFGAQPATNVACKSSTLCTALSPYGAEGTVPVTVTVGSSTSTSPISFTFTHYSPPTVNIVSTRNGAGFSRLKLLDRYPAIFTAGNIYLQITNTTATTQAFSGPTGPVSLAPGSTEGYNIPVNESSPYLFELTGTPNPARSTLTVSTKQPR